jgi:hypothetical protein
VRALVERGFKDSLAQANESIISIEHLKPIWWPGQSLLLTPEV